MVLAQSCIVMLSTSPASSYGDQPQLPTHSSILPSQSSSSSRPSIVQSHSRRSSTSRTNGTEQLSTSNFDPTYAVSNSPSWQPASNGQQYFSNPSRRASEAAPSPGNSRRPSAEPDATAGLPPAPSPVSTSNQNPYSYESHGAAMVVSPDPSGSTVVTQSSDEAFPGKQMSMTTEAEDLVPVAFDEGMLRNLCDLDVRLFLVFRVHCWKANVAQCGMPLLLERIKQSMASAREVATFFKKRSTIEEEYARAMTKLARSTTESYALSEGKSRVCPFIHCITRDRILSSESLGATICLGCLY